MTADSEELILPAVIPETNSPDRWGEFVEKVTAGSMNRPPFRGCVVCYTAEMGAYGLRKGIRRVTDDD